MRPVSLSIITREGMSLLGMKKTGEIGKGLWNGPGGKFDASLGDTDMISCAIREGDEEFGIRLLRDHLEKIAIIMFYAAGTPLFECHIFKTSEFEGEPAETKDMVPAWYGNDNLPYEKMHEADNVLFPKFLSGEKFNANVYFIRPGEGLDPDRPPEFFLFEDTEAVA